MSRIIEAKAIISGEDRLSGVLDKINGKLKQVGKSAKISAEIDRMNRSLGNTKRQLDTIGRVNKAQEKLNAAKLGLTGAQDRAERVKAALAQAKKVDDKTGVADLAAQQKVANRALAQASGAVERQAGALREAKRELSSFGVPITNLVAHENALKASADRTATAIEKETTALKRREDIQQRWDVRRQNRRQAAVEAAARGTSEGALRPVPGRMKASKEGGGERSLGPLAGFVGAYEAANAYKQAAAFDRRITLIGQTAEASRAEIDGLAKRLHGLAQETATPIDSLAGGLESLVAQGRNLKESMEFLPSVARTAAASGAQVDDIAKSADTVGTNFGIAGQKMQGAFDIMAAGGKAGQFELKDMARYLPSLGAAAGAAGFKGEKGLADLVAMLQTVRKGSGTAEEAAASMGDVFAKIESQETVGKFKKFGVDLRAEMDKARKEGKNLIETFEGLVDVATKGDLSKIPQLATDKEFARAVRALMTYRGEWQKLSQTLQNTSAGTVANDLAGVTKDAQSNLDRLSNAYKNVSASALRLSEVGGVNAGLGKLAEEFGSVADALDRINKANAEGGLPGVLKQIGADAADHMREKRKEWADKYKKDENGRIAEMEADNKTFREKLVKEGHSPESIAKTMAVRERDVERARRRYDAASKASRDARKIEPPKIAPTSPSVADGVPSLIDAPYKNRPALPFPQKPTSIPESLTRRGPPQPPRRPKDIGRAPIAPNSPAEPTPSRLPGLDGRPAAPTGGETGRLATDAAAAAQALAGLRAEAAKAQAQFDGLRASGEGASSPEASGLEARIAELAGQIEAAVQRAVGDQATVDKRAAPDQRLEATVKPDQVVARIDSLPPVTGSADVNVQSQVSVSVKVDQSFLQAQAEAAAGRAVAKVSLSSGGRSGSISMPGAASTPGAAAAPSGP